MSNVTNLRVDKMHTYTSVHTVNIQDDDPTPQLVFSSDASVLQLRSGLESVTTPTIKVNISDG